MRPQHKSLAIANRLFKNSAFRLSFFLIICALLMAQFLGSSKASRGDQNAGRGPVTQLLHRGESNSRVNPWMQPGLGLAPFFAPPPSGPESINTFKGDCTTPESHFSTGQVVCAKDANFTTQSRAIYWVNPDGDVVQTDTISAGSPTSSRTVTQAGNWQVYLVGLENEERDLAKFSVSDPDQTTFDLSVFKSSGSTFNAGGVVSYRILAQNAGPDDASTVTLIEQTPNDSSFLSSTQDSGPTFTCTPGTGNSVCTIDSFPSGATASFTFFYTINAGATTNEVISNTVSIQDGTTGGANPAELHPEDNSWTATNTITGTTGTNTCSVACPDDITVQSDTTDPGNPSQPGAVVHFSPPAGNSECGPIIVDHCNDCFFPEGTTVVTGSAATGESCSFRVVVTPSTGAATIVCPSNKTATADTDCEATVNVGTPTTTGNNVTVSGVRSDGQPMYNCDCFPNDSDPTDDCDVHGACTRRTDAPFPAGETTITWTAISHDIPGPYPDPDTELAHRTGVASCTQTITVNDTTPPVIGATDSTASADANCQAAVPDYTSTVTDNCSCASADNSDACAGHSRITVSQSPAAGTLVGVGPTTVHITANDGSSNNDGAGNTTTKDVTFTVADTTPPTVSCPAPTSASADANCQAPVPDVTSGANASDNCSGTITKTQSPAAGTMVGIGPHTITVTATDAAGNHGTCTTTFTVNDTTPPIVSCPAPTTGSADANCQAPIPNVVPNVTASDNCGSVTVTQSPAAGTMVGLGPHTITVTATDGSSNSSTCTTTFTVVDTTGPVITLNGQTPSMWPPNHKYQTFQVTNFVTSVHDNCTGNIPVSSVVITKVTSDELENSGGDGNTLNDIVISSDCKSVQLRSERDGGGNGRVYTIYFKVVDAYGNPGTATAKVVVPHNPGETVVDSGPHYTVMSSCP